jgi:hypothetical protein
MTNNTSIVDINPNRCQIIEIINQQDDWIVAIVKARLIGGKRWKKRKVLLSKSEFRQIQLGKLV